MRHEVRSILSTACVCVLGLLAACSGAADDEGANGSGGSGQVGTGGGYNPGIGGGANPGTGGGMNPGTGGGVNPGTGGGVNPGTGGGVNPGTGGGVNPGTGGGMNPGTGGAGNPTECTISATHSASPRISSVFTVEFVTDFAGTASINFGKVSEGFTLVAPVGEGETSALLLGMTHTTEYQYQVVVDSGTGQCISETMTLTTGGLPGGSGIADATIQPGSSSSPVESGFVVTSSGIGQGGPYAYIVNHKGELVWWYEVPFGEVSAARMSWDGKFMYARELNVGRAPNGRVIKVSMDGLTEEVINLSTSHHDLAPTPDGGFLYIAGYGSNSCDGIFKYPGEQLLFDVDSAFSWFGVGAIGSENCHVNAIHYNEFDNSVTFSDTNHNALVGIDYETGALKWIYGGEADSTFTGDVSWDREHGHHMPDADTMYLFSNGAISFGESNIYRARFSGTTATWDWHYNPGVHSGTLGDVQGLPGGNVLVAYSSAGGLLHEVDESEQLVQIMDLPFGNAGYANHRPTLYGKPPR